MNIIYELHKLTGLSENVLVQAILSLAVITGVVGVRMFLTALITQRLSDIKRRYYVRRIIDYAGTFVIILSLFWIWFHGSMPPLATFLGLVSAGLAVALHDPIANIAAWVFILLRKPFQVGDRIEIEGTVGDVIDIRVFQFSVIEVGGTRVVDAEQSTGRILHIPNGKVLRSTLANYEIGFSHVWDEIPIVVTFESDWETAKGALSKIINRHVEKFSVTAEQEIRKAAENYMIFTGKLTPIVYTSIQDSGVRLTMRYMVRPRQIRGIRQAVSEDVLREFGKNEQIDFAYPTTRFFSNTSAPGSATPDKSD